MVKITDVAREAGVAPSTVSRALNNAPSVGPEYVQRVRAAAERLGYRPNSVARNLRRRSTDVIALIIPDVGNHYFTAVARGVEDVARETGLSVLLCNSDEDAAKEASYLTVVESERVAGVLLAPHRADADVSVLVAADIPLVAIDRSLGEDFDSVVTDSFDGAMKATTHLVEQGWTRPACCAGPDDVETARLRVNGYTRAVTAAGIRPMIAHGTYSREGGAGTVEELLSRPDPPDSLFVSTEQMALGVLAELRRRNLVPGVDIGVITFDDTPWAPLIAPPMTVMEQPAYEIGARATRLLVARIRGDVPSRPLHVTLPSRLIVRDSSLRAGSPPE